MGGNLDIAVMMNPGGEWNDSDGDHATHLAIEPKEWEELFFNALKVPEWENRIEGEDMGAYYDRQKKLFQENLRNKGYEMLGRIWDMYDDAIYWPSEINQLLRECLEVQKITQNTFALSAIEKLISACHQALLIKSGLCLSSD